MPITDPRAIAFSNDFLRPLAARMRNLKANIDAAGVKWFAEIAPLIPNDSSVLVDGRDVTEGASVLTGADITNLVTQMLAYQTQLNQGGVAAVIQKPIVGGLPIQNG